MQDAAAAALSAIEEALELGVSPTGSASAESQPAAPSVETDKDDAIDPMARMTREPAEAAPVKSAEAPLNLPRPRESRKEGETAESLPPRPSQPQAPVTPTFAPANDDRRTIGELRQALQIAPNRSIMTLTFASIGLWIVAWALYVYFHKGEILEADGSIFAPKPVLALTALIAPIVFLFITGLMARRAHEMRLIANSMTEVAIRLIEPETIATEQVVSLSQAIRREAASMGDGIERALQRAGELEVIVRTEVTNLERSYTENERRIRLLIDELSREREAIVVNADNARTALFGARDALSQELATTSAHLAETVSAAGARVTSSLGTKGEEIRLALEQAGETLENALAGHSRKIVGSLDNAREETLAAIEKTGDELTQRISSASADVARRLA
ncbi:MAG: apolipoprotein acyltransferase, partial [Methylocystis sp.]|nr:apolipoprotein acyltransferase [Methylocystis sp.]